jgi:hypothetical protein
MSFKTVGLMLVLLAGVFGAGWMTGASGRTSVELALETAQLKADAATMRGDVLDGRVSLFAANFGDARQHFQAARQVALRIQTHLREVGQADRAGKMEIVLAHLADADRLASALDPGAQAAAGEAIQALATTLAGTGAAPDQ